MSFTTPTHDAALRCSIMSTCCRAPMRWSNRLIFPVVREIRSKPATSLPVAALDGRLSLRVENVKPGRAHGNAQLVAHLHPHGRLDARHHDTLADLHIEQDFRAELLDHLDHSIEARVVEIGGARHGEVLRAHAERDLVADMAA